MLIKCPVCNGKGKDNDIPRKRCFECNGKGKVEIEEAEVTQGEKITVTVNEVTRDFLGNTYPDDMASQDLISEDHFVPAPLPEKPWYKKIFN